MRERGERFVVGCGLLIYLWKAGDVAETHAGASEGHKIGKEENQSARLWGGGGGQRKVFGWSLREGRIEGRGGEEGDRWGVVVETRGGGIGKGGKGGWW